MSSPFEHTIGDTIGGDNHRRIWLVYLLQYEPILLPMLFHIPCNLIWKFWRTWERESLIIWSRYINCVIVTKEERYSLLLSFDYLNFEGYFSTHLDRFWRSNKHTKLISRLFFGNQPSIAWQRIRVCTTTTTTKQM